MVGNCALRRVIYLQVVRKPTRTRISALGNRRSAPELKGGLERFPPPLFLL